MEVKPLMTGSWGGFTNTGVTCYVNSTLQFLLHIDPIFEWLKNSQFDVDSVSSTVKELSKLHRSQRTVDPKPLLSWLNYISPKLRNDTQEDAHEFLDGLLKCFQVENQRLDTNIVECTFGWNLTVTFTCEVCAHNSSQRKELNVPYFSLVINKASSVEDALQQYLQSSGMKSYCRHCKGDTSKRQDISIDKLAPFLILHLKRFIMVEKGSTKLCRKIKINRALNINGKQFRLAALVLHHGTSIDGGHYTALCRREEEWWHYNDHNAKMILMDEQTLKGLQNTSYFLLYEDITVQPADTVVTTPGKKGTNCWVCTPLKPQVSPKEISSMEPISSTERGCSKPIRKVKRKLDMDSHQNHIGSYDKAGSEHNTKVIPDDVVSSPKEKSKEYDIKPINYEICSQGSDDDFRYFTGLTKGQFLVVYDFIGGDDVCSKLKYTLDGKTPIRRNALKISLKTRLFLVLLKMRRDLSNRDIGKIMGISASQTAVIFNTWLRLLALSFKEIEGDLAVSAEKQNRLKPTCYKPYKNLRMIIDCAEFVIERSNNMQQQGNTYSNYKHRNTVKVLFGTSCYGGVSYVSGGYEGRITDQEIVMQCGFLDILKEGDAIMADRGFLLEEEMAQRGVKLIKPPNMTRKQKNNEKRKRFTAREEVQTKSVAGVRIYVEHVIGKIRNYQILDNKVELLYLPLLPDMIFVASCLHNFTKCYIGKSPLPSDKTQTQRFDQ